MMVLRRLRGKKVSDMFVIRKTPDWVINSNNQAAKCNKQIGKERKFIVK